MPPVIVIRAPDRARRRRCSAQCDLHWRQRAQHGYTQAAREAMDRAEDRLAHPTIRADDWPHPRSVIAGTDAFVCRDLAELRGRTPRQHPAQQLNLLEMARQVLLEARAAAPADIAVRPAQKPAGPCPVGRRPGQTSCRSWCGMMRVAVLGATGVVGRHVVPPRLVSS
jgi:hypothetical protein